MSNSAIITLIICTTVAVICSVSCICSAIKDKNKKEEDK